MEQKNLPKAFVSCSLRQEDSHFVEYTCKILKSFGFEPFGTVGKFDASPENPVTLMKTNIPLADVVVICATPRYSQIDLKTGVKSFGLPEMVHVEAGMAYMAGKPVIVFVQHGTQIGSFLPNVTQYIELHGRYEHDKVKIPLITRLFESAIDTVNKIRAKKSEIPFGKIVFTGFALYGGFKFLEALFSNNKRR